MKIWTFKTILNGVYKLSDIGNNNLELVSPGAPGDYCKDKSKKINPLVGIILFPSKNYLLKNIPIADFNVKS